MRLSYFRELTVLAQHLNFSAAASHLHMTQSGLSRHISALEKEVGIKIFERDTHRVKLTEKGKQFLKGIEKILDDYDLLRDAVSKDSLQKITIGFLYLGVERYLSNIINLFETAHPEVKINYLPAYPDTLISGLLAQQVDVAILPRPAHPISKDLLYHDIHNESVVLMLHRSHPLATHTGVRITELENERFISLQGQFGDAMLKNWSNVFKNRGLPPMKNTLKTATIEEAALRMKSDTGVMLLPKHIKEANISGNIKFIDITDKDCYYQISLFRHTENSNPIIENFISFYQKNIYE